MTRLIHPVELKVCALWLTSSPLLHPGSHHSIFCYFECDFFRLHMSETTQCLLFCISLNLLSIMSFRLTHVMNDRSSFCFQTE
jgi:hypothetical protein